MGSVGKVAFVVILALGAVTGIVSYYLFALVMPHPGVVESLYRTDLAPATGTKENKPVVAIDESKFHNKVAITILKGASTQGNPDYDPKELSVKKGNVIKVENLDSIPHTVTNGAGPNDPNSAKVFDTSLIMGGESGILQTEETTAGEYAYYCTVHPYMTGTLKIQ